MQKQLEVRTLTDDHAPAMKAATKVMRRLKKAERQLKRRKARAHKNLEREAYEWSALDI
jgi:hypothetical protein